MVLFGEYQITMSRLSCTRLPSTWTLLTSHRRMPSPRSPNGAVLSPEHLVVRDPNSIGAFDENAEDRVHDPQPLDPDVVDFAHGHGGILGVIPRAAPVDSEPTQHDASAVDLDGGPSARRPYHGGARPGQRERARDHERPPVLSWPEAKDRDLGESVERRLHLLASAQLPRAMDATGEERGAASTDQEVLAALPLACGPVHDNQRRPSATPIGALHLIACPQAVVVA